MKVIAAPGTQCPMEGKPKDYVTDKKAIDVPDTAYYRRLKRDGSLLDAGESAQDQPAAKAKKEEVKGNDRTAN